ncbi:MAG TPA: hypothetical protein VF883_11265 [Thermoanaerobaculia bacterium]|jgi:hypothetical protein
MSHLSQEEFVLSYYGEPELGADSRQHLASCDACVAELAALAAVLDKVTPLEVPEPAPEFEARVWDRLQWRLRGERRRTSNWMKWTAAAATVAIAFFAGILWKSSNRVEPTQVATATATQPGSAVQTGVQTGAQQQQSRDRVLLIVVGEHFDESERVLVELTNITPDGSTDITDARGRAQELLASNRLYRTSATDRGEGDVATLLDELEPVLMQLAHAPDEIDAEELRSMQKRVESKGLVFKLRVVRADVHRTARTTRPTTNI